MTVYDDLLVADLTSSYEHMRHYQELFTKRLDFGLTGFVAVVSAVGVLIEHFRGRPFILGICGLLLIFSSVAGSLLVWSLALNRVYFVRVARYVNESRDLHLRAGSHGLVNHARMYNDYKFPQIFHPTSTQSIDIYFLALSVSVLIGGSVGTFELCWQASKGSPLEIPWITSVLVCIASTVVQVGSVIWYWYCAERGKRNGHKRPAK